MEFIVGDKVQIVRGLILEERIIAKRYSNGSLLLNEEFLGRKKVILSADYTTKGFRKAYVGSKDGMEISMKTLKI